ncbi:leukocidin family pore-forming toxin [Bacillus cereus]
MDLPVGKLSLTLSIIDDPNADKLVGIVKTDGTHILPDTRTQENSKNDAIFEWPSAYHFKLDLLSDPGEVTSKAQFLKVLPVNENLESTVTSTVAYNIGGGIKASATPEGSGTAGAVWTESVSYKQPNYRTVLTKNTEKEATWDTSFISAMNQGSGPYTRDANNFYGNELFLKTRNGSGTALHNILSGSNLPPLIQGGFDPSMIAVIIADKSEKSTPIKLSMDRDYDTYQVFWNAPISWYANNFKNTRTTTKYSYGQNKWNYYIDWQNHKFQG